MGKKKYSFSKTKKEEGQSKASKQTSQHRGNITGGFHTHTNLLLYIRRRRKDAYIK